MRLTTAEEADLESVASALGVTVTSVIRDAVNEYVADYRDRPVFEDRRIS